MAAAQLFGSMVAVKKGLPSLERCCLSSHTYRVSYSSSLRLDPLRLKISKVATPKLSVSWCLNTHGKSSPGFDTNTALKYTEDESEQLVDKTMKLYPTAEPVGGKLGMDKHVHDEGAPKQRKGAKIHDFCFGIPFGGFLLFGGLLGFLFTRNLASLTAGVLYGGGVLASSICSLKVWRKELSSLPFILVQAALAASLLWKQYHSYSLTKNLFPSGSLVFVSAGMLCFYLYVMISGGNPPPKKKLATS